MWWCCGLDGGVGRAGCGGVRVQRVWWVCVPVGRLGRADVARCLCVLVCHVVLACGARVLVVPGRPLVGGGRDVVLLTWCGLCRGRRMAAVPCVPGWFWLGRPPLSGPLGVSGRPCGAVA